MVYFVVCYCVYTIIYLLLVLLIKKEEWCLKFEHRQLPHLILLSRSATRLKVTLPKTTQSLNINIMYSGTSLYNGFAHEVKYSFIPRPSGPKVLNILYMDLHCTSIRYYGDEVSILINACIFYIFLPHPQVCSYTV